MQQIKNILESPKKQQKPKRKISLASKPLKMPKFYSMISSTPTYLKKITTEIDSLCKSRLETTETSLERIKSEKKFIKKGSQKELSHSKDSKTEASLKDKNFSEISINPVKKVIIKTKSKFIRK